MSQKPWLQLTDYSNKYEVSISTLRRRIREESIDFKLDNGKYFLLDEPPVMKPRGRKPVPDDKRRDFFDEGSHIGSAVYFEADEFSPVSGSGEMPPREIVAPRFTESAKERVATPALIKNLEDSVAKVTNTKSEEPVIVAANRLLEEIKKAYSQILLEKEELILQLKEEIADLRTLSQVLESENDRLRNKMMQQ